MTTQDLLDTIKHKVRVAAAQLPRPIGLHEAALAVSQELSPADVGLIVNEVLEDWLISETEPVRMTDAGTILCGPAADANDPDAWGAGLLSL